MTHPGARASIVVLALGVAAGCSDLLTRGERLDPQSCAGCHPDIYREWSGSMHAYASVDPVFRAMNARGQRETNGQLGDFCVKCHAPMALAEGATQDGTNIESVDAHLQGVTCIFCHQIDAVTGTHNAQVRRADDGIMRGGIADPIDTPAHESAYSSLHARNELASSTLCGACHDVVLPNGHALENTFAEWKSTLYSSESSAERLSCQGCHMPARDGQVARVDGAPVRRVKSHMFPAVDVAITAFPERDAQRAAVERELATTLQAFLCVQGPTATGGATVSVALDNIAAGHSFPSGVAHDRRVWLELVATRGARALLSTGVIADDQPITALEDPNLFLLRDRVFKADGTDALMFWEVARSEPNLISGPISRDPADLSAHRRVVFSVPQVPDRITMRMRMQPIGREVLDSLVATGDLDPAEAARIPTYDLAATRLEWRAEDGEFCTSTPR